MSSIILTAEQLRDYRLPTWDELPGYDVFNQQMVQIVRQAIDPLFPRLKSLTVNMVQNYLKWGLLPKPNGRKYTREHIAWCMVISMLKSVFNIEQVKDGIVAYQAIMPIDQAYNHFAESFAVSMRTAFGQIANQKTADPCICEPPEPLQARQYLALTSVTRALAYHLLTTFAIEQDRKKLRAKDAQRQK